MKIIYKIVLMFVIGLVPIILLAQSNLLDDLMKKYANKPGFYFLDMQTNMFNSGKDENSTLSSEQTISIKILTFDEGASSQFKTLDIYEQFNSGIDVKSYKGLVEVKSSGNKVDMMIRKEGNILSDVIIIIRESNKVTFFSATGSFNLKDLLKLSAIKNCQGLEILEKLCED